MVYKINNLSTQLLTSGLKYWHFLETWAGDLKNRKYDSGALSQGLITAWAFGFKLQIIFHRVEFIKPV